MARPLHVAHIIAHPSSFLEGARLLKLPPTACAYVGDTVSRDVSGAQNDNSPDQVASGVKWLVEKGCCVV